MFKTNVLKNHSATQITTGTCSEGGRYRRTDLTGLIRFLDRLFGSSSDNNSELENDRDTSFSTDDDACSCSSTETFLFTDYDRDCCYDTYCFHESEDDEKSSRGESSINDSANEDQKK